MAITINGTSGITTPEVTLDNTSADGGQVVLKSSGYDNWNLDNYNGRLRAYNGSTERMTIDTSGNVGIGTSSPALGFVVEKDNGSGYVAGFRSAPGSPILTIQNTGGISQIQGLNSALSATANIALQVSGGNVGIGTSSPSSKLHVKNGSNGIEVYPSGTWTGQVYNANDASGSNGLVVGNRWAADTSTVFEAGSIYGNGSGSWSSYYKITGGGTHIWGSGGAGTERMRIDGSGNLLVNKTATGYVNGNNLSYELGGGTAVFGHVNGGGTANDYCAFIYNTSRIGGIVQNGASAVSYATSSDYRLKENIAPMTGALAKVQALKPVTYTWKVDGSEGQGFIAHELQAVVPDCVTGEKDAVDADGNPVYQGIDTSFLVATLTAAIQEQQAIITEQSLAMQDLKARIETLENK